MAARAYEDVNAPGQKKLLPQLLLPLPNLVVQSLL